MDNIIVYLDDAEFALHQLMPMKQPVNGSQTPTHWLLVACPPRMTRHISKWVNHSARTNWRQKWSEKLFTQIAPQLQTPGDRVTLVVADGALLELTQTLQQQHGVARVLDARRPKFGQDMQPVTPDQPASSEARWTVPGAIAGMGAALVLAAE